MVIKKVSVTIEKRVLIDLERLTLDDDNISDTIVRLIKLAKGNPKFFSSYKDFLDPEEIAELSYINQY